ncbi:MAG: hypothetical protein K2Y37_10420 [Pirellulales bacterium]|nr:hypothetical protein [Pirellulales bacterium]
MHFSDPRWLERAAAVSLLLVGAALVAGNLWFTAARSTIPLALDGRVAAREVRHEKHPGKDDVCLLHFEDGRTLHVDTAVFAAVDVGQWLYKTAWQHSLDRHGANVPLDWSADARGMWPTMGVALVTLLGVALWNLARR